MALTEQGSQDDLDRLALAHDDRLHVVGHALTQRLRLDDQILERSCLGHIHPHAATHRPLHRVQDQTALFAARRLSCPVGCQSPLRSGQERGKAADLKEH